VDVVNFSVGRNPTDNEFSSFSTSQKADVKARGYAYAKIEYVSVRTYL